MFIVWGTKIRKEEGGVIADWCEVCCAPSFQVLTHIYKVGHVYYISLGKGEYAGTNRQCTQCGTARSCNMAAYARPMTHDEAYGRGIEQVLQNTNPTLYHQLEQQRSFENRVAERIALPVVPPLDSEPGAPPPLSRPTQRMVDALRALGTLDARDKDVVAFTERLHRWDYLSLAECEVLLHQIDAFVTDEHKTRSAIHFMRTLPTPTPGWITGTGCILAILVLGVGLGVAPFLQSWLWGFLYLLLTAGLWFVGYNAATKWSVRSWVRRMLIPKSGERDIDMRFFVGLLAGLKASNGSCEEKIGDMARNVDLITDELVKQGRLGPEGDSPSTGGQSERAALQELPELPESIAEPP